MGEHSDIAWTDHTFNPWVGCTRVSPGCQNCYAEALDQRWAKGEHWGKNAPRRVTADANWRKPIRWNRDAEAAGRPALVFCASMADVFEDREDLRFPRLRLFELIDQTPNLIWLLLTKRPENVLGRGMVPGWWARNDEHTTSDVARAVVDADLLCPDTWSADDITWPDNVWIGTTVEDQTRADERIPELLKIPAPVRFLSCEPLLGPLDLDLTGIDWVIAGGESGSAARPMHPDWVRDLRDACLDRTCPECGSRFEDRSALSSCWQCTGRGAERPAAFFFKQWGGRTPKAGGDELDGRRWQEWPAAADREATS